MTTQSDRHQRADATADSAAKSDIASSPPRGGGGGPRPDPFFYQDAGDEAIVFLGDDGVTYLAVSGDGLVANPLRSLASRAWLNTLYRDLHNDRPPRAEVMSMALDALEADAHTGPVYPVRTRIAAMPDRVLLDLGDTAGRVVEIGGDASEEEGGWEIRSADYWVRRRPPVYFTHPSQALPLPLPERSGTLDDVRACLGAIDERMLPLVEAYLLHCFLYRGDYWVLALIGEQGSGKSYIAEATRMLIDPSKGRSSGPPRDEDALVVHANAVGIVVIDNLSVIPEWLSDALCRLSTGAGVVKRMLYTNFDVAGWYGQRPVIVTAIHDVISAGDLLDRSLIVPLKALERTSYVSKSAIWARFHERHAKALGGLLNALAQVLAILPEVRDDYDGLLPRMTDASLYGIALERVMRRTEGEFMRLYAENREHALQLQLEGSRVATYLLQLAEKGNVRTGEWQGTMTALLTDLNELLYQQYGVNSDLYRREKSWPKDPARLSGLVTRLAPALKENGLMVVSKRQRSAPTLWTFTVTKKR